MPRPRTDLGPRGLRVNSANRFAPRWARLYEFGWSPTFWGPDTAVAERPRNRAFRSFASGLTLANTFGLGLDHAFASDSYGRGLAFNGGASSFLSGSTPAWLPSAAGGYTAATIWALFTRTGAYPGSGRSFIYSFSRTGTGSGDPLMGVRAGTPCAGVMQMNGVNFSVASLTGFNAGLGEVICLAFTSRTQTDNEAAGFNFTTGQFVSAVDTNSVGTTAAEPDRESIATIATSGAANDRFEGTVYAAGFTPFGFTSAELAELVSDPWALFEPETSLLFEAIAAPSRKQARVIWM